MQYIKTLKLALAASAAITLAGCATNGTHYYWGEYENIVHNMYVEPGSEDPDTQIQKLTTDIQQAENNGKPTPPGIYAHLGYVYAMQGQVELSTAAFNKEMALYPESKVFIDGMLKRAQKNQEAMNNAN